ncbi:MAG: ATP-binding protein [Leptolyngbyaceae cyanobacterium HOT.MB2.61]|nr:ATP-binding protein [Leptolyngbyaceae cyanobacterium HOT.MB2.61]
MKYPSPLPSMPGDSVDPFPDNWTYLKAELNWLDRVLSLAIARQRKEAKEVDRLARTRADRATSHWWKGLVSLEGEIAYDSPAEMPRRRASKGSYQQQMEAKIQASEQRQIGLGLPLLRNRLQLSVFEKNLVLMTLAPEINRRYGQIYNYLQETEQPGNPGLPMVDLLLRILCRNDAEWRLGRQYLTGDSVLLGHRLLEVQSNQAQPFLTRLVKLSDPLVNFLLADKPDVRFLEELLQPNLSIAHSHPVPLKQSGTTFDAPTSWLRSFPSQPAPSWSDLVLPQTLLEALQHLCQRFKSVSQVDQLWGFEEWIDQPPVGAIALLIGASGTGKTMAVRAIARELGTPFTMVDLALLPPNAHSQVLLAIAEHAPTVLLLKSAQIWLGQSPPLLETEILQFLHQRQQQRSITLLSTTNKQAVKPRWQRRITPILEFPLPDEVNRLRLWQQAFPPQTPLHTDINWEWLAHQFRLTGGEIQTIAREAAFYAAAEMPEAKLAMKHLLQALKARHLKLGKG